MNLVPMVIEQTNKGERGYDIYSLLLKDRILFLGSEVDDMVANSLIAQMLFLSAQDPTAEISFYINSPGGSVTDGLAIYDVMQMVKCPIATYCLGQACSMGSLLLAAGTPGRRFAMPNARIMIHQPHAHGLGGQVTDIQIAAREMQDTKEKLTAIYAKHTGKTVAELTEKMERDLFLDPTEAINLGLIDKIVKMNK
ncbi:MAG TPA: ATP-dependent Clp protease proteolytic subunit [Flavobacterium sp.]|jgi:ATP-dependent Clp protease protease subunit|nr:ATP-dependent Clp protease proteolytic subunit [Flavobacterium sp.]